MPEWATISIREELIAEVRKLVQASGRYRSISEFVAESIRLRLEEVASKVEAVTELPQKAHPRQNYLMTPVSMITSQVAQNTKGYMTVQLQLSEQIWWVLVRLFGDFIQKNIKIEADCSRRLRKCRTLMDSFRSQVSPECDMALANRILLDLQQVLQNLKHDLIATASSVSNEYAEEWISEIDKAERGELQEIPTIGARFVPDLRKNNSLG